MSHYGEVSNISSNSPQTSPAKVGQVPNNGGGYSFALDSWQQLDRFLILGQVGATYYAAEQNVVMENVGVLQSCLEEDGVRVVDRIVEISHSGRAPKNDPAIFCLAQAASSKNLAVRQAALAALPKVCRIGTHLYSFVNDVTKSRRWGRGLRNAVASWYTNRDANSLAMQALKYKQRDGWSHRDLLRLSHASPTNPEMNATFRWIVGGQDAVKDEKRKGGSVEAHLNNILVAVDDLQRTEDENQVCELIHTHKFPREAVPTSWLNSVNVWGTLLPHMGLTAMIRNLGKMTSVGLLKPFSESTKMVCEALTNKERIVKDRIHPIQYLLASGIYGQGHGDKGSLKWEPVQSIVDALDEGFHASFANVVPTGKNIMLAIDVSGSMGWGFIAGAPGVTPAKAAAAMAMITARVEKNCHIVAFSDELVPVNISPNDSLSTVMDKLSAIHMGGTDCAAPMTYAQKNKLDVDVFHVYTDNDTNSRNIHPFKALKTYRKGSGRNAKLCVVGMQSSGFTIADPSDSGMMDVVGFDTHSPQLMADFARGDI